LNQPGHDVGPASEGALVRGIRKWDLIALVLNVIIGAGIFGLPSTLYRLVGPYSLVAFVVCALLAVLILLCFAEMASRFTTTGGPYLYARAAFGPLIGFEVGWLLWLARVTAFAALCNLFVEYLSYFWPAADAGMWRAVVVIAVVVALTGVNIAGVREAALVSDLFTVGKLIPLVLFVIVGTFFIDRESYSFGAAPDYRSFSTAVLLLVFAFSGFEMAVVPAGETLDPRRHAPLALLGGIAIVAVLYISIQAVCIGTLPDLATSARPLADAADRFLGAAGASIISFGALVSITGTLIAVMLSASRVLFAMAEHRQLPALLGATNRRFRTPHVAILLSAAAILALSLAGTFLSALTISTIIRLIMYGSTCAAVPVLRRKAGAPPAAFMAPAGTAVAICALGLVVWLLSNSASGEARTAAIAAALGLLLYVAFRPRRFAPVGAIGAERRS
jgi:APA family basic amino acid/polyamine antiporter